jgi:multiple sugar transport system substrate-binding protein
VASAKEFVHFLVGEGWLAHYLNFGERMLPPMQKLLHQPFWLDPSGPHRMAGVMQVASRPMQYDYTQALGDWRHDRVWREWTWAKAIHRVAAEGITPERAVDEAIARIKQMFMFQGVEQAALRANVKGFISGPSFDLVFYNQVTKS